MRRRTGTGLPRDFGLGLIVVGALLWIMALVLFVLLSMDSTGPRGGAHDRVPVTEYQEAPAAPVPTISVQ